MPCRCRVRRVAKFAAGARKDRLSMLLVGFALLGGCAYRGEIDSPLWQRVTWFSYLGGTDIAQACAAGAGERYRIIYNGRYDEQLRSYEITRHGDAADLVVRVQEQADLAQLSTDDLLAPWRWREAMVALSPAELATLRQRLADSGFFTGPPVGLVLHSKDFYWAASGCSNGTFHYYAWVHAQDQFRHIGFAAFLLAHDPTGVAINPPRPVSVADYSAAPPGNRHERRQPIHDHFDLEIGSQGLGVQ
jgi:hypothetical protein